MPFDPMTRRMVWPGEERIDETVKAVIVVLQRAKTAIESRQISTWLPDPLYRWRGKPLDAPGVQGLMRSLDKEFEEEIANHPGIWTDQRGFTRSPGFSEMPPLAQIALAQMLDQTLHPVKEKAAINP